MCPTCYLSLLQLSKSSNTERSGASHTGARDHCYRQGRNLLVYTTTGLPVQLRYAHVIPRRDMYVRHVRERLAWLPRDGKIVTLHVSPACRQANGLANHDGPSSRPVTCLSMSLVTDEYLLLACFRRVGASLMFLP